MIQKIYNSKTYIFFVVILALISLFAKLPALVDWSVYGLFIFDLQVGSVIWLRTESVRTPARYFKHFAWDILACVPVVDFGVLKMFRLVRLVRLFKLRKLNETNTKFNVHAFFSLNTLKELSIYLLIYFIGNVYVFSQLEHVSIIDSIYWLVETMTSVGYGDVVPHSEITKVMAILLMIIGIATIGYLNGVITTSIVTRLNNKHS